MQKIIRYALSLLLVSGFLLPANVSAVTYTVDQSCHNVDVTNYENIADNVPHEQGFRPLQNRLKQVNLKISGMNVTGNTPLRVRILPFGSETVLAEKITLPTVSTPSIRTWTFDEEITLIPGNRYVLRLERVSGTGTPYWFTNGDNCYSRGSASRGGFVVGYDYDFETVGYTYTAPVPFPATPDGPIVTTPNTATTTDTTTTAADANKVVTNKAAAPVDTTIQKPVLVKYEKNEQTVNPPFDSEVSLTTGDKVNLFGTSFAGSKVKVFAGENAYDATVEANGDWTAEVNIDNLIDGSQIISAQALKDESGSEVVELLKLKVLGVKAESSGEVAVSTTSLAVVMTVLGFFLLLLIGLLIYSEKKYHGLAKIFQKKNKLS